jgi:NAD(P)-dependent dehydrogenase (short-subunit alcohol dehydrogenase family)
LGIARKLADEGFDLIIHGKSDSQALKDAQVELQFKGSSVFRLAFDISNVDIHDQMIEAAWNCFGRIDCLVNNAGVTVKSRGDILDVNLDSFDEQLAVNLRGTFFLTQAVTKRMIKEEPDHFRSVVIISSSNAVAASIDRSEYCIVKSGLSMMVKLFALRLAESGINVYEIRPGLIETDMTFVAKNRYAEFLKAGFSPINRWGQPSDVGSLVAILAIGKMAFSTGDAISVDGGLLITRY